MKAPVISIITVVYNDAQNIAYTIGSVLKQTYPHIEYIIVDGGSTDGTLHVIGRYRERVDVLVSENDKGIYDAMNKGLALASGDYVLFMNSGDELYDENTLQQVFSSEPDADIYYGETKLIDADRRVIGDRWHKTPEQFTWRSFRYGMSICHQAIYIRRSIAEPYDLGYQLSADIDWVIRIAKKARKIVNTHRYVARYLVGGLSKKRHLDSLTERYSIFRKHYGLIPNLLNHGVIAMRLVWARLLGRKPGI